MPLLKIANGPWSLLLQGSIQEHLLEVYVNPKKWLYVQILENEDGKFKNLIAEFYKPYFVMGEAQAFIQTLPRELLLLSKHYKDETYSYLVLGSGAISIPYEEELVLEQTDILFKQIEVSTNLLREVGKAYDVQLKELHECEEKIANGFFSTPLLVPSLVTNAHFTDTMGRNFTGIGANVGVNAPTMGSTLPGEMILGTLPSGIQVKEPISFFKKTLIVNGRIEHRARLAQIIMEGMLLTNIPVVVFDWGEQFSAMRNANPSNEGLRKQKIELDAMGFPLKDFLPPENVKMDFTSFPAEALIELMGLSSAELGSNFLTFMRDHSISSMEDALRAVKQLTPTEKMGAFQIASLARLFRLLEQLAPHYWDGNNPLEEISKNWFHSIGRVGIIRMQSVPVLLQPLLVLTLMRSIYDYYKQKGVTGKIKSLIVVPESQQLFVRKDSAVSKAFVSLVQEGAAQDVGVLFTSAHDIDVPGEIAKACEAQINVINGTEAAVDLAGRKSYRLNIRDTVSQPVMKY